MNHAMHCVLKNESLKSSNVFKYIIMVLSVMYKSEYSKNDRSQKRLLNLVEALQLLGNINILFSWTVMRCYW